MLLLWVATATCVIVASLLFIASLLKIEKVPAKKQGRKRAALCVGRYASPYIAPASDHPAFRVRSRGYFSNGKKKVSAGSPIGTFLCAEVFKGSKKHLDICSSKHTSWWKSKVSDTSFVFCLVLITADNVHCAVYFEIPMQCGPLYEKFLLSRDDDFCNDRFKLIPRLREGPLILRTLIGSRPALLAKKLKFKWCRGERYLAAYADISTSRVAAGISQLCQSLSRSFSIDLAILCEGRSDDELPEKIMGIVNIDHIDLGAVPSHEQDDGGEDCKLWLGTGLGLGVFTL